MSAPDLPPGARERLTRIFAAYPELREVVLYGSRVTGASTPRSDIDLATRGITDSRLGRLALDLEESDILQRCDVRAYESIESAALRDHIERDGIAIYRARNTATVSGDPGGRRLARRRAARLSEAGMLLRAVEVLLRSAGFDPENCRDLAEQVAREERALLQRAEGRIEPRRRFKHKESHPLLASRELSLLFIDEGGHPAPQSTPEQPVFALGAVAMSEDDAKEYVTGADELKIRFFGRSAVTLHEPQIRHRKQIFSFGGDDNRYTEFVDALENLIARTPFVVFGAAIRKDAFVKEFVESGIDPYLPTDPYAVAITILLERYVDYLLTSSDRRRLGRVTFESQGPREDAEHQAQFARLLLDGTQWVPESSFQQAIQPGANFVTKSGSDPVELADIFVRDLYEWARSGCREIPARWGIFTSKMYCRDDGRSGKFGVKVFPDSDIRELIQAHRAQRIESSQN